MEQIAKLANAFRARAEATERRWPFDRRSHPVYALIAAALAIEIAWIAVTDFTIPAGTVFAAFAMLLWLLFAALAGRAYGFPRIACFLEALAILPIAGALTAAGTALLSSVSLPFADPLLSRADRALGFEWLGLLSTYQAHPWLFRVSWFAYRSFDFQIALIAPVLVLFGRDHRLWLYLTAFALAGWMTALIYPFFPAYGPIVLHGLTQSQLPHLAIPLAWETGPIIEALRNGEILDLAKARGGLVSFPSFHAAAGVLFTWAARPLPWLGRPILVLNAMMIFSTIIIGDHYFVDLIGGAAVAGLSILASRWLIDGDWRAASAIRDDGEAIDEERAARPSGRGLGVLDVLGAHVDRGAYVRPER